MIENKVVFGRGWVFARKTAKLEGGVKERFYNIGEHVLLEMLFCLLFK